jgi:hypothetical protein
MMVEHDLRLAKSEHYLKNKAEKVQEIIKLLKDEK